MSRNSQQNRAARKRKKQQRSGARQHREFRPDFDAESLVFAGIEFAFGPSANAESLRRTVGQLAALDGSGSAGGSPGSSLTDARRVDGPRVRLGMATGWSWCTRCAGNSVRARHG